MKQKSIEEQGFLADPLLPPSRPGHNKTIEEERREDLETYRANQLKTEDKEEPLKEEPLKEEPLQLVSEDKEEPLTEEAAVKLDVAVSEAEAGKIKLSTVIPVKTIRLDIEKFDAFFDKKFYRVKLDYDLYLEVNAANPQECFKKIVKFAEVMLKGMLPLDEESLQVEEFIPDRPYEKEVYDFSG